INSDADLFNTCGIISPSAFNKANLKVGHTYKIKFSIKDLGHLRSPSYRHPSDIFYTTSGYKIYDVTENDTLIYSEDPDHAQPDNFIWGDLLGNGNIIPYFNEKGLHSDVVDGLQVTIKPSTLLAQYDAANSGWLNGKANILVTPSLTEYKYFPWQYDIIFSDSLYKTRTTFKGSIKSVQGVLLANNNILLDQSFPFYVINKSFKDSLGRFEKLDLVTHDANGNGVFDNDTDYVLVGNTKDIGSNTYWSGTVFGISFKNIANNEMPKANDVYRLKFKRPFYLTDSLMFTVNETKNVAASEIKSGMEKIKVVPNPYIATNMMEPALSNKSLNQRRRILFTHIPAECNIKIFTSSGVFVDEIEVQNPSDNGTAFWDLLTKEGLEVAAGIYIYHVKAKATGDEKIGKFAIVK
ncbi:MAG: hypothetical protein HXY50_02665, partial [Ignavibacteriaceae bacterium]|nr:hypothetical protein [Ignavibacteriaceae bacterium]